MNTGPSLLWHAEPITQTDTRPFCSTLTHDHRIAHAYSLHLTCVNWLCHQILNEPQQACMCRLSVVKDYEVGHSWLCLCSIKLPGAPVQCWSRTVRKVEPRVFYTVRRRYDSAPLDTFCPFLSHQQSRASHFPVAGFPFPHIQPPSTGLLTLLKHSSMRILVFFENPCKYHWSWAEKCFRRSLNPPTNNTGYPLPDVAFWHGPYSPLRVVEVPYREADVFSWWPHQNCYLRWQPGFSMTQFYAGKSSEVQRWGTSRIQNISKWVAQGEGELRGGDGTS